MGQKELLIQRKGRFTDQVIREVTKLHSQLGHPSPDRLAAVLVDLKLTPEQVACARLFFCSHCLQRPRPQLFRPVSACQSHHRHRLLRRSLEHEKTIIVTVMDEFSRSEVDVELADETFEKEIEVIEEACVR